MKNSKSLGSIEEGRTLWRRGAHYGSRRDDTKRRNEEETTTEKKWRKSVRGRYFWRARVPPLLLPPPRHTRLTNETLSYVCSNYCRHSAYTRSTQRALKYYPRHLAPFPSPHEKPPNGRSSSFVVLVGNGNIIAVVVVVETSTGSSNTLFLPRCNNSRVLGQLLLLLLILLLFLRCERTRFFYPAIWHEREAWPCS